MFIEPQVGISTDKKRFELVERKGIGHPDTICDLAMNEISIELSKLYLKETGAIQHHNMDKGMLVAGQTENHFGGGKIIKPMKLIIGDRATLEFVNKRLPIEDLAVSTAKSWFTKNLKNVDPNNIQYQVEIGPGSKELQSVFINPASFAANDTSALVGYAPLTQTESIVLDTEEFINSQKIKEEFPESGEDVKVMAFRNGKNVDLTIAMAFVDRYVESVNHYFKRKSQISDAIRDFLVKKTDFSINIEINCLDKKDKGIDGLYLTVLGTSADSADSGQVGRGNMANRVISPTRPAGAEATAGKNPVSHIGKIYNALSFRLADEIQKEVGFDEVFVWMYNIIGREVKSPKAIVVQPIIEKKGIELREKNQINDIIQRNLDNLDEFCNDLTMGKILVA